MSVTVDTNVLLYAANADDELHAPARRLIETLAAGPDLLHVFWPTVMGFLRIATHPAIFPAPLSAVEAIATVETLLDRPHVRSPGESTRFWDVYRQTAGTDTRGNHVPDAHLVALMREHGVSAIYTRDRDFRRYEGIVVRDPFA
jgi:hypothetical protein